MLSVIGTSISLRSASPRLGTFSTLSSYPPDARQVILPTSFT